MTQKPEEPRQIDFRIVVIDPSSMRILTTSATAAGALLPRIFIRAATRVAAVLTEAIEVRYDLPTIQLAILSGTEEESYCAVHEITDRTTPCPTSSSFHSIEDFAAVGLSEAERMLVLKIMSGQPNQLGRFARLGWIDELFSKIGIDRGRDTKLVIHQLNQGIDFCLLNLRDASGRNLWFKAVGEPNTREYPLTLELTRRFPQYLPGLVTTFPEWNGWVTESVEGVPLNETTSLGNCELALTALATMQQAMDGDADSFLELGAKDWTYAWIASLSESFFEDARLAMRAQTSTRSKPLTDNELDELQTDVETALREFMQPDIPDTLVHGDIGHGNIIATADGPVFLDWAETYIGHPFLCAEHLLADLARSAPTFAREQGRLRSFYADHWRAYVRAKDLETITALAPAVAAFVYALVAWEARQQRTNADAAWPLVRSMLRRTRRELDNASEVIR